MKIREEQVNYISMTEQPGVLIKMIRKAAVLLSCMQPLIKLYKNDMALLGGKQRRPWSRASQPEMVDTYKSEMCALPRKGSYYLWGHGLLMYLKIGMALISLETDTESFEFALGCMKNACGLVVIWYVFLSTGSNEKYMVQQNNLSLSLSAYLDLQAIFSLSICFQNVNSSTYYQLV